VPGVYDYQPFSGYEFAELLASVATAVLLLGTSFKTYIL
jgi:hypothetical protein